MKMQSFIKILTFFVVYLPTLCFGCQLFYYFGLLQASETSVFALGLNNSEVAFLGANQIFSMIINKLSLLIEFVKNHIVIAIYCIYYPFFIWYWWNPNTNTDKKFKIQSLYYSILYNITHKRINSRNDIHDKIFRMSFLTQVSLILFTILLTCYASFYNRGVSDFSKALKIVYQQKIIFEEKNDLKKRLESIGTLKENNQEALVFNLACGNYKCVGIHAKDLTIRTYLPENYSIKIPDSIKNKILKNN